MATQTIILGRVVGPTGAPGTNGRSAYESAVASGYEGTEEEWAQELLARHTTDADILAVVADAIARESGASATGEISPGDSAAPSGATIWQALNRTRKIVVTPATASDSLAGTAGETLVVAASGDDAAAACPVRITLPDTATAGDTVRVLAYAAPDSASRAVSLSFTAPVAIIEAETPPAGGAYAAVAEARYTESACFHTHESARCGGRKGPGLRAKNAAARRVRRKRSRASALRSGSFRPTILPPSSW